ncbi:SAM-dependent methyltransferase [Actinoallomurus purpureus]|nr:SAM-dependent methyltransferase [Actinoallomurus purpureus]MCO6004755.1 SAM-dependent methyltransferase [Actinoallomurus purpureus]
MSDGDGYGVHLHRPQSNEYDPSQPNVARMYDYLLGGKDNGLADRLAVKEAIERVPSLRLMAKENRAFLQRAVRYCTNQGIRQFVDVGAGLPTLTNTHEIAQKRARDARVVYVDNDPLVLAHGRAILARNDNTTVVTADLRAPDDIINHPELLRHIDWSKPVAVLLVAILHFIPDTDDPYGIVAKLRKAMAPGSHLVLSHGERNRRRNTWPRCGTSRTLPAYPAHARTSSASSLASSSSIPVWSPCRSGNAPRSPPRRFPSWEPSA